MKSDLPELKKLTKPEGTFFKELDKELEKLKEKAEQERIKRVTPQIIGTCSVCAGDIKEIKEVKWPGGQMMIGGKGYLETTGAYCVSCGLMYNLAFFQKK